MGILDDHQSFDCHTLALKCQGTIGWYCFFPLTLGQQSPWGLPDFPLQQWECLGLGWLASVVLQSCVSLGHFTLLLIFHSSSATLCYHKGQILQTMLPSFPAGFCPDSANGRVGRRLEVAGGIAGSHGVSSVAPAPPGWVLHDPWPLHSLQTLSLQLRASIHAYFANFGLSHYSLFDSWLLYHLYNHFPALNSFCNKCLSGFCFSVSVGPVWEP